MKSGYYLLKTDGGMDSNGRRSHDDPPGQAAIGVALMDPKGRLVDEISRTIGPATNDVAEYQGLIEGLRLARGLGIDYLRVYMDSELVVDQINGVSKVKEPDLEPLYGEARALYEEFASIRISWIPRKWNKEADDLAQKARQTSPTTT